MIESIRHKGLKRLFEKNDSSKLPAEHLRKIRMILGIMHRAKSLNDINYSGSGLHKLSSDLAGFFAVKVSGNYRIIFRFEDGSFHDVDYVDYH
ncbi:type II toxin-antitoxin system RelE/ParE family toxin [Catalinimonas sp. 4WD22]|uniref:type II toxin-antitoxin system RelE/ParE family toxin n=1 Tax=Catalinimonas locisalis TaxID=3133978 RepID=UPI0031012914